MSTQIAVRLDPANVAFLDDEVSEGRARSRAEVIDRLLAREGRRRRALADIERLRRLGSDGHTEFDAWIDGAAMPDLDG